MEKAVFKTLIYASIFSYPMTILEIHKWLIGKKTTLRQVEKTLVILQNKGKIGNFKGFYYLRNQKKLVTKRIANSRVSKKYLYQIRFFAHLFKVIPWIKLVGISGNLAVENAGVDDDIDLFVVTGQNRLWISRLLLLILITIFGKRRTRGQGKKEASGKLCVNLIVEEGSMQQSTKDLFVAHEVLQMKVLWQRHKTYSKFLEENSWVFRFIPNWIAEKDRLNSRDKKHTIQRSAETSFLINKIEIYSKRFQLWYMGKPSGMEKVLERGLYLHPYDYRPKIMKIYKQKTKNLH